MRSFVDRNVVMRRIHVLYPLTTHLLVTRVTDLVFCFCTLVWFLHDAPLRAETCRNIQYDIIIWNVGNIFVDFVVLMSWIYLHCILRHVWVADDRPNWMHINKTQQNFNYRINKLVITCGHTQQYNWLYINYDMFRSCRSSSGHLT
jgi:hypothetical protein